MTVIHPLQVWNRTLTTAATTHDYDNRASERSTSGTQQHTATACHPLECLTQITPLQHATRQVTRLANKTSHQSWRKQAEDEVH